MNEKSYAIQKFPLFLTAAVAVVAIGLFAVQRDLTNETETLAALSIKVDYDQETKIVALEARIAALEAAKK